MHSKKHTRIATEELIIGAKVEPIYAVKWLNGLTVGD